MMGRTHFIAALAGLYALLAGIIALPCLAVWADLEAGERDALAAMLAERAGLIAFLLLIAMAALGIIFDALYRRHVRLPFAMRERLEVVLGPNHVARLDETGPAGLRALAGAVNRLAEQRDALERDVAARVDEAKWRIEEERNRFATLIAELSQSIIVCNADGRILLYNNRARALFSSETDGGNIGAALVGLGRSIFGVLEHSLIAHGLEKIQQRLACGEARPIANFVTATPGGQLVRAQMAPVLQRERETADETDETDATIGGYVLILDDITRRVDLESQRDQLLQSLTEGARAALGNIRAAIENLSEFPDMEAPQRDRFIGIVREEAQAMSARLDRTVSQYSDALKVRWPLEEMAGTDLIQAAQRRVTQRTGLPAKTEELESGLWLKVDSFSLLQGISYLVARLQDEFNIREIRLRLLRSGRHAHVDIIWSGTVVSTETLAGWDLDPMSAAGESSPLTLREVIDRHDGELWFQREKLRHRAYFRILLPAAGAPPVPEPAPAAYGSRPEYYDFDLFQRTEASDALDQLPLAQLAYTVFDTETTGLEPSAGDEIIQIGAARIVNGRLLRGEVFEQLIDPRRPITAASVRVHGITQDMVVGQPTIERVLPRFHAFCQDTVLVAHNAAFDMRFLQLKENATGVAFRQPVLDTLLLSAVVHPNQDLHSLESIAERLGVALVGRHTALGDAIVTGEVLLKLIPLLAAQGIHTLRQAREASARTYYAKVGY